jgi:hypothetical protein
MRELDEIIINGKTLKEHLELHIKWLNNEYDGVKLDLRGANLRHANLRHADLQHADLKGANLQHADLLGVDLRYAYLEGADLDFSCLPLWCGGLNFKIDEKQAKQLMYHVINLMQYSGIDTSKVVKGNIYKWLEGSHLVTLHNQKILEEENGKDNSHPKIYNKVLDNVFYCLAQYRKALTPPTEQEVCEALSEYLEEKVVYDEMEGFYVLHNGVKVSPCVVEINYDKIKFNELLSPKLITMIGRFYEKESERE